MDLPPEILDEIVAHSIEHESILQLSVAPWIQDSTTRTRQWDRFISCDYSPLYDIIAEGEESQDEMNQDEAGQDEVNQDEMSQDETSQDEMNEDEIEIGECFTYPSLQHLYNMRLVSRSWNASAIRILRRYWWWPVDLNTTETLERALQLCAQSPDTVGDIATENLFNRLIIPEISHVKSIQREYDVDQAQREGKDIFSIYTEKRVGDGEGQQGADPTRREENRLLRSLIDNLTRVETFSVTFDGAESNFNNNRCIADGYDIASLDMAMDTLLYGLGSRAFQHLTDLRLTLPGTRDIGRLAVGIPDNVKQQLKHLFLEVVDGTGPGGSYNDGFFDAPSNLQAQYPNQDYQDEVWAFIASCHNLASLGLHCTHHLSLDRLEWEPRPNSRGLRSISLSRIYASAPAIIKLLTARDNNAARERATRRIEFLDVDIVQNGGHWGEVFGLLATKCPELEFFDVFNIGYAEGHENFTERQDHPYRIWSRSGRDGWMLANLMNHLVDKAGGEIEYPANVN